MCLPFVASSCTSAVQTTHCEQLDRNYFFYQSYFKERVTSMISFASIYPFSLKFRKMTTLPFIPGLLPGSQAISFSYPKFLTKTLHINLQFTVLFLLLFLKHIQQQKKQTNQKTKQTNEKILECVSCFPVYSLYFLPVCPGQAELSSNDICREASLQWDWPTLGVHFSGNSASGLIP